MPNNHVRRFIDDFEALFEICLTDDEERALWDEAVGLYRKVIRKARQKQDFTDADIDNFEDLCDDFFEKWVDLHGQEGVTTTSI